MKPINLVTQAPWRVVRKNKMGAKKTRVDGITFDSQMEAKRYCNLKLLVERKEVLFFLRQPMFDLGGGTTYRADFLVFWMNGLVTVEDCKGYRTEAYIKAKKQTEALYPLTIIETRA